MARYTEQELDSLKSSIDLVALIQSKGIKLEKHGKDLKGLCPFHQDKNPSMIITPAKRGCVKNKKTRLVNSFFEYFP